MTKKKIRQEEFDNIKSDGMSAIQETLLNGKYLSFVVGRTYKIQNPSNKDEVIECICSQNNPFVLKDIKKYY